ncbi:KGW motif small protein [Acinetobacter chinensis]|uniref:KGW motif small protein n=1 Tax=Acinetobacter chinensis TaxID=2004650 RepID=A0ABU3WC20_9GAMM|nr:KGW motif small protein [Acinetobacter chinensis]MDV2467955.1 KGW motif small protein [Acinetobacter chinensis]
MLKTADFTVVDKAVLRKKGWKLFAAVMALQMLFLILGYALQM